tara:strand:+ start:31461 stop:31685 length:225 start_codon:yes stop_codon:yes gene_type:complete
MSQKTPLLAPAELMIPAVAKILQYFDERLTKLRKDNDSFDAHVSVRGQIAEIKAFKKVIEPKTPKDVIDRTSAI